MLTSCSPSQAPRAGALFKQALEAPLSPGDRHRERRLLLCLLAAFADADVQPGVRDLARRLGVPGVDSEVRHQRGRAVRLVDRLLGQLEADGVLAVSRAKGELNRYELRLGAES